MNIDPDAKLAIDQVRESEKRKEIAEGRAILLVNGNVISMDSMQEIIRKAIDKATAHGVITSELVKPAMDEIGKTLAVRDENQLRVLIEQELERRRTPN